jgi:hypothetical protein
VKRSKPRKRKAVRKESSSAKLGARINLAANALVVPAVWTKHGVRRNWREMEFTCMALQELYPDGEPRGVAKKVLVASVNDWLLANPEYRAAGFGLVSFDTIKRAMQKVWRPNI